MSRPFAVERAQVQRLKLLAEAAYGGARMEVHVTPEGVAVRDGYLPGQPPLVSVMFVPRDKALRAVEAALAVLAGDRIATTCPQCGLTSHNVHDVMPPGYCASCAQYYDEMGVDDGS